MTGEGKHGGRYLLKMRKEHNMAKTIEDFKKWQEDTLRKAIYWESELTEEALKQKTYNDALEFLDKNLQVDIHDCDDPTIREFYLLVSTMIGDVRKVVIRKALETEVKHD